MKLKKILSVLLTAAMVATLTACSSPAGSSSTAPADANAGTQQTVSASEQQAEGKSYKIGFVLSSTAYDFFVEMAASAKKTAAEMGHTIEIFDSNRDIAKQTDYISQCINNGYDAIAVVPRDSRAMTPSVEECVAADIPFINIDSKIENAPIACHIASDNKVLGQKSGELAVKALTEKFGEPKGNVIVMHAPQFQTMMDRFEGFKEVIAQYPNIKIIEEGTGNSTAEDAAKIMESFLSKYQPGEIDLLFGTNAGTTTGSLSVIASSNRTEIKVVGVDSEDGLLTDLTSDKDIPLYGIVAQQPILIGKLLVENAINAIEGKDTPNVAAEVVVVTKENAKQFVADLDAQRKEIEKYK